MDNPNPVLVELVRGGWVENRHRGAFVIADASGRVIAAAGDIDRPIFPRSAIKSMQALAMARAGAIERFALSDEELALACASHQGEEPHVAGVSAFLHHVGHNPADLECGAHPPTFAPARDAMRAAGGKPTSLHNNCSGKHAGMLSVATALDVDPAHYVDRDHPVQKAVRAAMEEVLGTGLAEDRCGVDGCSVPTWAAPLRDFARGFARMGTGEGLGAVTAAAAARIIGAAMAYPHLVGGTENLDTLLMQEFGGRLFQKGGAEGVQCGILHDKGWGYALKIDDGNMAASQAVLAKLLLEVASPDDAQRSLLERYAAQTIRNVRHLDVGELRAVFSVAAA
jgi:L-asparaginase II